MHIPSCLAVSLVLLGTNMVTAVTTREVCNNPQPGQYATVAAAINDADEGDIIRILDTEHFEAGFTIDKPLYIKSGSDGVIAHYGITSGSIEINAWFDIRDVYFYQHTNEPAIIINNPSGEFHDYDPQINNCAVVSVINGGADFGIIDGGVETSIVNTMIFYQQNGLYASDPSYPYYNYNRFNNLYRNIIYDHQSIDKMITCSGNKLFTIDGYFGLNIQVAGNVNVDPQANALWLTFNDFYNPALAIGGCIDFNGLMGNVYTYDNKFHKCPNYAFLNDQNVNIINEDSNSFGDCRN